MAIGRLLKATVQAAILLNGMSIMLKAELPLHSRQGGQLLQGMCMCAMHMNGMG